MAQTMLRVVFDTNTFAPDSFKLLKGSRMQELCASSRITPVYGHVFLEETFRAYGKENRRKDLVESWMPFVRATAHRLCKDFVTIWHEELVRGRGKQTNIFMRPRDQRHLFDNMESIPLDGSWRAWHGSKVDRDIEDGKRAAQREVSKEIRQEVADWRKAVQYTPKKHGTSKLTDFFEREVDVFGRDFIHSQIPCWNPSAVVNRWSRAKAGYPYFTTFVVNMLYISHHAATQHNDKIDLNAQADLDLMTHLLRADAVVSNEEGFLKKAFSELWAPRGKVLMTSEQFARLIEKF